MERVKQLFQLLIGSELLRNSSVLVSGTIIAQLIPIFLQPFIRRLFPPEAFGAYAVYLSTIGIIVSASSLKYELVIMVPKNEKESINVVALTLISNLLICSLIFICICIWHESLIRFLNIPDRYSFTVFFIPLGIFLMSINQNFHYYLVRQKAFISASVNKLARRGAEGISQVTLGFINIPNGLVFSDLVGNFVNALVAIYQSLKNGFSFRSISLYDVRSVAKQFKDYPKFNLLPSLMSASSFLLPAIIISKNYSADITGHFDLSKLLLSIPLVLISSSLANVMLQKVSERFSKNESLIQDLKPIVLFVLLIAFFEILIVMLFGEKLFTILFGKEWLLSGKISKILVWSYALNFILASFTSLFIALRRIKVYSIWQILYFLFIVSLFLFHDLSFQNFIYLYVIFEVICYLTLSILIVYILRNYEKTIKNSLSC